MASKREALAFAERLKRSAIQNNVQNSVSVEEEGYLIGKREVHVVMVTIALPFQQEEQTDVKA
jgi:hypothetical protein